MSISREIWSRRTGWSGLVVLALMSGNTLFAQQVRDEVARIVLVADPSGEVQATATTEASPLADGDQPEVRIYTVQTDGEAAPVEVVVQGDSLQVSEYWIGVGCTPAEPVLRSQLKLGENEGLVVIEVMPDSPAKNVGLQVHDVLVEAGDKKLHDVSDLMAAVEAAKENDLNVKLVRAGEQVALTVKPAKRPEAISVGVLGTPMNDRIRLWRKMLEQGDQGNGRFGLRVMRPGVVVQPGSEAEVEIPDGLSISITKQGKDPARISVKQGEKSWDVTEDKLGELPDDVRPHVERLLGRGGWAGALDIAPGLDRFQYEIEEGAAPGTPAPVPGPNPARRVIRRFFPGQPVAPRAGDDARFDDLNRQLSELREMIENLQKQLQNK